MTTTFKLLHLPFPAQRKVLAAMCPADILEISMLSRKMFQFIRSFRIRAIYLGISKPSNKAAITFKDSSLGFQFIENPGNLEIRTLSSGGDEKSVLLARIGKAFGVTSFINFNRFLLHVSELFAISKTLILSGSNYVDFNEIPVAFHEVIYDFEEEDTIHPINLVEALENHFDLETVRLNCEPAEEYNGSLNVPIVILEEGSFLSFTSILTMKCQFLKILRGSRITVEQLNHLIRAWISGAHLNGLEKCSIWDLEHLYRDRAVVLSGVKIRPMPVWCRKNLEVAGLAHRIFLFNRATDNELGAIVLYDYGFSFFG